MSGRSASAHTLPEVPGPLKTNQLVLRGLPDLLRNRGQNERTNDE